MTNIGFLTLDAINLLREDLRKHQTVLPSTKNMIARLAAANLPISGLPSASLPLDVADYIPLVQGGVTQKATISDLITTVINQLGYVTVGNGVQYDYQTIHDAYTDGKDKLWVLTDITETVSTVLIGSLTARFNNGVTLNLNDGVNIAWNASQALVHFVADGVCFVSYTYTSTLTAIDISQVFASPPGSMTGNFLFINQSDPSVIAKPLVTNSASTYLFNLGNIIYLDNGGLNSYFDIGYGFVDSFVLVCANPANDAFGIKIRNNGSINNVFLGSDCSANTTLFDVTNTKINNGGVINGSSVPNCYLSNSTADNITAIGSSAINIYTSASNAGEASIVSNSKNFIMSPTGAFESTFTNCKIAGVNLSGLTGGTTTHTNCDFAGFLNINNASAYLNYSDCRFDQGLEISNSPGTILAHCNYGTPGGSSGLQIDAGATNTQVIGGRTNTAIIDNGVNTQISPSLVTF